MSYINSGGVRTDLFGAAWDSASRKLYGVDMAGTTASLNTIRAGIWANNVKVGLSCAGTQLLGDPDHGMTFMTSPLPNTSHAHYIGVSKNPHLFLWHQRSGDDDTMLARADEWIADWVQNHTDIPVPSGSNWGRVLREELLTSYLDGVRRPHGPTFVNELQFHGTLCAGFIMRPDANWPELIKELVRRQRLVVPVLGMEEEAENDEENLLDAFVDAGRAVIVSPPKYEPEPEPDPEPEPEPKPGWTEYASRKDLYLHYLRPIVPKVRDEWVSINQARYPDDRGLPLTWAANVYTRANGATVVADGYQQLPDVEVDSTVEDIVRQLLWSAINNDPAFDKKKWTIEGCHNAISDALEEEYGEILWEGHPLYKSEPEPDPMPYPTPTHIDEHMANIAAKVLLPVEDTQIYADWIHNLFQMAREEVDSLTVGAAPIADPTYRYTPDYQSAAADYHNAEQGYQQTAYFSDDPDIRMRGYVHDKRGCAVAFAEACDWVIRTFNIQPARQPEPEPKPEPEPEPAYVPIDRSLPFSPDTGIDWQLLANALWRHLNSHPTFTDDAIRLWIPEALAEYEDGTYFAKDARFTKLADIARELTKEIPKISWWAAVFPLQDFATVIKALDAHLKKGIPA